MALADFNHIKAVIAELDIQRPSRFGFTEAAVSSTGQAEIDALTGEYIIDDGSQINSIPSAEMVGFDPIIIDTGLRTQAATAPRMALNHFFGRLSLNLLKLTDKLNLLVKDHLVHRYITPSGNVLERITVTQDADEIILIQHQSPLSASAPITASAAISIPAAMDAGNAGVMTGTDKKNLEDLLSRDKTIAGVKTFNEIPVLPASNPILDNHAVRNAWLAQLDAQNVKLSGAQSIDGVKTFNAIPVLPSTDPILVDQATRKGYIDTLDAQNVKITGAQTVAGKKTFSNDIQCNGKILAAQGAATAGGYSFTGDGSLDTGMFSSADGVLDFYTNGHYAGGPQVGTNKWDINVSPKFMVNGKHHGNITISALFALLSPYIPNTDDEIKITGGYCVGSTSSLTMKVFSRAKRTGTTTMELYYALIRHENTVYESFIAYDAITQTNQSAYGNISITW